MLKKRNVGLQEQVTLLEKAVQNLTIESKAEKRENITAGNNIHITYLCMHRSRSFCGVQVQRPAWTFFCLFFFSPQLILQLTEGVQWIYCREN